MLRPMCTIRHADGGVTVLDHSGSALTIPVLAHISPDIVAGDSNCLCRISNQPNVFTYTATSHLPLALSCHCQLSAVYAKMSTVSYAEFGLLDYSFVHWECISEPIAHVPVHGPV